MKTLYQSYKDGTLSPDKVMNAAQSQLFGLDNPGFCIACGTEHHDVEPDARERACDHCGENGVYGAEELVMMGETPDDTNPIKDLAGELHKIAEMD